MNILMLASPPAASGPIPKIASQLAAALQELGNEVVIKSWGSRSSGESLRVKTTDRITDIVTAWNFLRTHPQYMLLVHTSHDKVALTRDIPLLLATRRLCPHIVLQFHGSSSDMLAAPGNYWFKFFSRWLLRLSDAAFVLSSEEQREWSHFYPQGRFEVVSNPFQPAISEDAHGGASGQDTSPAPVILFVGRLMKEKGVFDLLEAASIIREKKDFRLWIVGDGPDKPELIRKAAQLSLDTRVSFTGYLKGTDLERAYRDADIFVFPTFWKEGFPTVLAEAMNYGLPIITTHVRGISDHLREGVNALFVPIKDPPSLAQAITSLLEDKNLREQMQQANHQKVAEFAPGQVARQYLDVLRAVVNG